jgi:lysophospholipase L1-like esterase
MSTRTRRKRAHWTRSILVVGILVVAFGAQIGAANTTSNAKVRGVVLFVGDSNVTLGAMSIDWALTWHSHTDNGYVPVMDSRVGATLRNEDCLNTTTCATTDYWKTRLGATLARVDPNAVVNNLGINDTGALGTSTTPGYAHYGQKVDWFMALIPRTKPVLWTNLPCAIEPPNRLTGCRRVNQALANATTRWSNLWVLDWAGVADSHPGYMAKPGNDVHLSGAGETAWTNLVLQVLDARFPPP